MSTASATQPGSPAPADGWASTDVPAGRRFSRVLIANRGEIAVRVIRACQDEGLTSVAVYAEPDREALHVRLADEAVALGGETAAESYLLIEKILDAAQRAGADAVHPGYGFLSENADFARAVEAAGLVWIGPPAEAIEALGDKVSARRIATAVGAPLAPGTTSPVKGTEEVLAFADEHGLPVAIKAAYGGGGRGIKVARTREEIPELYESAVREAIAAFGRGECFVERFLDRPRHVETQCLADAHGGVVVVSTRDCSLQRRNQKLVEEAPAPFLTDEQNARLAESSKALLREAGYVGAGTCEFLVGQDGTLSFLEVNTRLQVEHPVTEEVTGIDLVREQFRIARGERLGYGDPVVRGHSFEFRLNGEDPGRNFLPAPGTLTTFRLPSGPGVRVDTGVVEGETVSGAFDSMIAKLIVTGATRAQALQRAARALGEAEIAGMATVLPFHQAVVRDPAFAPEIAGSDAPFSVHTRWIETEFQNTIEPAAPVAATADVREQRHTVTVEVNGKRVDVTLPTWGSAMHQIQDAAARAGAGRRRPRGGRRAGAAPAAPSTDALTAPMQGTVVKVVCENGQSVAEGDLVLVLEAMKMEQPLTAHRAGVVSGLEVSPGETVTAGTVLATISDPS
ncbi:acetyl/propionyl/methylcrotonyl-CoA carboxylase subunit alpha [Micrococcus sp.]|uniref:acetyl/propionyl/methylcrotonyl-CoA carboxylase subunit alpha n=1 Tax=Micrococcus sp. TaxID=1271 RepID=UPI002A912AD2|nr:biotin carboxylase N-terminal domain-containing protein [Micrococcus sp.]MDY6054833.1 biotin carboxylase N-terminal domain-containing protein [Micrococcus sp.]